MGKDLGPILFPWGPVGNYRRQSVEFRNSRFRINPGPKTLKEGVCHCLGNSVWFSQSFLLDNASDKNQSSRSMHLTGASAAGCSGAEPDFVQRHRGLVGGHLGSGLHLPAIPWQDCQPGGWVLSQCVRKWYFCNLRFSKDPSHVILCIQNFVLSLFFFSLNCKFSTKLVKSLFNVNRSSFADIICLKSCRQFVCSFVYFHNLLFRLFARSAGESVKER